MPQTPLQQQEKRVAELLRSLFAVLRAAFEHAPQAIPFSQDLKGLAAEAWSGAFDFINRDEECRQCFPAFSKAFSCPDSAFAPDLMLINPADRLPLQPRDLLLAAVLAGALLGLPDLPETWWTELKTRRRQQTGAVRQLGARLTNACRVKEPKPDQHVDALELIEVKFALHGSFSSFISLRTIFTLLCGLTAQQQIPPLPQAWQIMLTNCGIMPEADAEDSAQQLYETILQLMRRASNSYIPDKVLETLDIPQVRANMRHHGFRIYEHALPYIFYKYQYDARAALRHVLSALPKGAAKAALILHCLELADSCRFAPAFLVRGRLVQAGLGDLLTAAALLFYSADPLKSTWWKKAEAALSAPASSLTIPADNLIKVHFTFRMRVTDLTATEFLPNHQFYPTAIFEDQDKREYQLSWLQVMGGLIEAQQVDLLPPLPTSLQKDIQQMALFWMKTMPQALPCPIF